VILPTLILDGIESTNEIREFFVWIPAGKRERVMFSALDHLLLLLLCHINPDVVSRAALVV